MPDEKTDRLLQEFLETQSAERGDGITLRALHMKLDLTNRSVHRIAQDRIQDKLQMQRYGRRLKTLEEQVGLLSDADPAVPDWRPDPAEITGTHQLAEVQRALQKHEEKLEAEDERKRESILWWRRQRVAWVAVIVLGVIGAMATGCVGYVAYRVQTLEKSINDGKR